VTGQEGNDPGRPSVGAWDGGAIAAGLEAVEVAFFRSAAAELGAEFVEAGDHTRQVAGLPHASFNRVMAARLPEADPEGAIDRILGPLQRRGLPVSWSVWPTARPADLGARLLGRGFAAYDPSPGMVVDLARLPADLPVPAGLEIRPVADAESRRMWLGVVSETHGFSPVLREAFRTAHARSGGAAAAPITHLVATRAGTAVGAASVVAVGGIAGIGWVGTPPEARRQGIGAAVSLEALRRGRDMGCTIGGLWASPLGTGVYRRLGFQEVCSVRGHRWTPAAD
jgi:GNAT superfamily N-acetyltransferase